MQSKKKKKLYKLFQGKDGCAARCNLCCLMKFGSLVDQRDLNIIELLLLL